MSDEKGSNYIRNSNNVKGQKVMSRPVSSGEIKDGSVNLTLKDYPQGSYAAVVKADKQILAARKIFILTNKKKSSKKYN